MSGFATIPARNERQAMDWSLVLVSQGIEATIETEPEAGSWQLVVNAPDYSRALQAIRQYRLENRPQAWLQELPGTGLLFDWRAVLVTLFFVLLFAIEWTGHGELRTVGVMSNQLVAGGQWWRTITAVTLHGDLPHLAANVSTGLFLFGLAFGAYGPGVGLLTSLLAGIAGNIAGYLFYPEVHRGLGASGMVMGALGLLAAQSLSLLRHGMSHRQLAIRGVASACLLLVLLGFNPGRNVDVLAHVAGFVAGLALGAGASLFSSPRRQPLFQGVSAGSALFLIFFSWWLALRAG